MGPSIANAPITGKSDQRASTRPLNRSNLTTRPTLYRAARPPGREAASAFFPSVTIYIGSARRLPLWPEIVRTQ